MGTALRCDIEGGEILQKVGLNDVTLGSEKSIMSSKYIKKHSLFVCPPSSTHSFEVRPYKSYIFKIGMML